MLPFTTTSDDAFTFTFPEPLMVMSLPSILIVPSFFIVIDALPVLITISSATLIVSKQGYETEIVSVFGSVVTLSVPAETPRTSTAALRLDLSWLLREQCKRLQELVDGLNALGISPRDLIAILQAIKASGALQAEIEVL